MAERGMRAMPPPLSSALALATCSLTCFSLTGASAKACLPQIVRMSKIGGSFPIFDPPATDGFHIAPHKSIWRRARGHVIIAGYDHGTPPSPHQHRSEEHTSELQSLMRISYAVFCLKKK